MKEKDRPEVDLKAIRYAREHLDLSKNLNDQGYYGPLPNDADPRPYNNGSEFCREYYEFIDQWIKANGGKIDNEAMDAAWDKHSRKGKKGLRLIYY